LGGRWLDVPARGGAADSEAPLELPVPGPPPAGTSSAGAGDQPLLFEVTYAPAEEPVGGGWPWEVLRAPAPVLPVAPAVVERRWLLPPGLVPVSSSWQRLPGPVAPPPWLPTAPRSWSDFLRVGPELLLGGEGDGVAERAQALADAAVSLRGRAGRGRTLTL